MYQQITIVVTIDTMGAINTNNLGDHIYLVDDLDSKESMGNGTSDLTTVIDGTHWADGSQASEAILNWLIAGIGSLPPTLPRNYLQEQAKRSEREILKKVRNEEQVALESLGILAAIKSRRATSGGAVTRAAALTKVFDLRGKLASPDQLGDENEEPDFSEISLLPPIITDISGEAVDKGIIYPVQGATPIGINAGWYWNATLSTHQPGTYSYTMRFTLYKPIYVKGSGLEWEPVDMTHTASVLVKNRPMTNSFTHGGMGYLPIF